MAKYVVLVNFTDQGVRTAKDTVKRFEQARDAFQKKNVSFDNVYWTLGRHDIVAILDAPDDETIAAALLQLGAAGNVNTETLRAFTAEEMGGILQQLSRATDAGAAVASRPQPDKSEGVQARDSSPVHG
jgi:uncharacterized protein with GYD domain